MTLHRCPEMILELVDRSVINMALVDTVPSKLQRTMCVTSGWHFDVPLLSQFTLVIRNRVPSLGSFMCTLQVSQSGMPWQL